MDNSMAQEADKFGENLSPIRDLDGILNAFPQKEGFSLPALQQLKRDTDEDTTLRIMARFIQNLEETVHQIDQTSLESQRDGIQKLVHRVAGTAELLGFMSLGSISRELECQLKSESLSEAASTNLNKFMEVSREVLDETHRHCPNLNRYLL